MEGTMRFYVPVMVCFACFMYLITLACSGCTTTYPSYYGSGSDGGEPSAMDGDCAQCHMVDGDGIVPPGNHWAGEVVDTGHDACTQCHDPH